MSQTVRYTAFIHGQFAPEKIVFVRADDLNWFTTDTPSVPPGEDPIESYRVRWSKVIVSHTSPIEVLVAEELNHFGASVPVTIITDHTFS